MAFINNDLIYNYVMSERKMYCTTEQHKSYEQQFIHSQVQEKNIYIWYIAYFNFRLSLTVLCCANTCT